MPSIEEFITRWSASGGHERGSAQPFILELCDLLELEKPPPPSDDTSLNDYAFERAITRTKPDGSTTTNFLDLYKAGHFVLETKQGVNPRRDKSDPNQPLLDSLPETPTPKLAKGHGVRGSKQWDKSLERAYEQARRYIRDLPAADAIPPFLIVCDVGYVFEIFADFSGTRGTYAPFPVAGKHRIHLKDLRDEKKRDLLRTIFTAPHTLDPSRHAAKVTREVADVLAELAKSLEVKKYDPQSIALFLQRCLFTLFAEDVGLLPERSFENLLARLQKNPNSFPTFITNLWKEMATGTDGSMVISGETIEKIPHFNGGLFENPTALPLDSTQIAILHHAATKNWSEVEPAIFGTLLERALDPRDRHKLGAHYTPRSYVERLVEPTLLQPLREKWIAAKTAAALHHAEALTAEELADDLRADSSDAVASGDKKKATTLAKKIDTADKKARAEHKAAIKPLTDFHQQLCETKVLDPACGSGNFLYVAMARMKELEAEVLDLLTEIAPPATLTAEMDEFKVRPGQFFGIELNERAAALAQLVLWIGHFQWHKKSTGKADTNDRPLLRNENTIECRDAVLDYDEKTPLKNDDGTFVTIWDGHTTKPHPVTEKEVPDETARKVVFEYVNPTRTTWPEADYIVGNPPFIGKLKVRELLGNGYVDALRNAWGDLVPDSADFVMYWWYQSAEIAQRTSTQFGLITTKSLWMTYNRRVVESFLSHKKQPISLLYAIKNHPWIDSADGADVRIALTVGKKISSYGTLDVVESEKKGLDGEIEIKLKEKSGRINSNLDIGIDTDAAKILQSNRKLSSTGVIPHGKGMLLTRDEAAMLEHDAPIKEYRNGRDLTQKPRDLLVIDCYGYSSEEVYTKYPKLYQWLITEVKPIRDANRDDDLREKWWLHRRNNEDMRQAIFNLKRYAATVMTSKHRVFQFLSSQILPDQKLVVIGLSSEENLSILSSSVHAIWALINGGRLGVGNDPVYVKTRCFETFPFPDLPEGELKTRIRDLGERLDAHRKARQAEHPDITLTGMYNVLEKLHQGEPLSEKEKTIHEQGLVTLLKQIHDDLDAAVYEAYGWSDLWQWQQDLTSGTCHDPETGLSSQLELAPDTTIYQATTEYREKYEQVLLQRLVDLNHERAAEEARGKIRYLRPEFQDPDYGKKIAKKQQDKLGLTSKKAKTSAVPVVAEKLPWPKPTVERVAILKNLLLTLPPDPAILSPALKNSNTAKRRAELQDLLDTLASLGQLS